MREVQERNIAALKEVLKEYDGKSIVIGSHGTALSTIINFYDNAFEYEEFEKIRKLMPWIVKFTFEGEVCTEIHSSILQLGQNHRGQKKGQKTPSPRLPCLI